MALPKRRHSKTRRDKSRTHQVLTIPAITRCPNCAEYILIHRVCPKCGYYKGRSVIVIKTKEKEDKKKKK